MRKDVSEWHQQALDDFSAAEYNFQGRHFSVAAFLCQQAVEKALKALFLHETKRDIPQTHSLLFLASETSIPKLFHPFLGQLNPHFVTTRYPDVAGDLPSRIYQEDNCKEVLEKSKEVIEWIKKRLSSDSLQES